MSNKTHISTKLLCGTPRILSAGVAAILLTFTSFAQSPSPSPAAESAGRYEIKASTEIGGRWVDVNGNENKFRSDLNYRNGFRVFDSSILIEDNGTTGFKAFDSALIIASGWGSDPSGMIRVNLEREKLYRFDANVRRVAFFNNLNNHAVGASLINYHNYDTRRNFGDLDLTIFPESRTLRFRIGAGYNLQSGIFNYTSRASDAFPVRANASSNAYDFRAGVDGQVLGFNLSGTYGYRDYSDRTTYRLVSPDQGDQPPPNTRVIDAMERQNPITGRTHYGVLNVQRTFAERFDFTAKILYSKTSTKSLWNEFVVYRSIPAAPTRDEYSINGDASRPQTRGDLGMTWRVTDKFRVSDTFTYDAFHIDGGLFAVQNSFTTTTQVTPTFDYYVTKYRRYQNTVEGDYQFNNRFGVNVGYRFTKRDVLLTQFERNFRTATNTVNKSEDADNTTHTVIAGTKIKPVKNWSIYADIEKGKADTVFTRAGNADFTNFRIRSMMRFTKVIANVSFITKDSEIPTDNTRTVPRITDTKSRTFSATVDWNPIDPLNLSGGYNYQHLNSRATVTFSGLSNALSEYFVRDNYFFIDATVRPHKRVTFFGSYRWNKDTSLSGRVVPLFSDATVILGAYPIDFKTPEVRAAVRLNKYLDWNVGYQYYNYKERPVQSIQYGLPFQNYSAHMPYMSLRIYLGKGAGDR